MVPQVADPTLVAQVGTGKPNTPAECHIPPVQFDNKPTAALAAKATPKRTVTKPIEQELTAEDDKEPEIQDP